MKRNSPHAKTEQPMPTSPAQLINDIQWLTKPKRFKNNDGAKNKDQPQAVENPQKHKSESHASSAKSTKETYHTCPRCGLSGDNDVGLKFIMCDECTAQLGKAASPDSSEWCPMHYAEGRLLGPHKAKSQMKCGCCVGTCEICNPPAEIKLS